MKAAFIERQGAPSEIQVGEFPKPSPNPNEALIRVRAVSVNPIDTYLRSGMIPMPIPLPYIIGCDLAGEVVEVGEDVRGLAVGDRVWGSNQGLMGRQGTFSEFAAVEEKWLYPTPDSVTDSVAAAASLVGITAHLGLFQRAKLLDGETVLVNGASGSVGSTVVQFAKLTGARVIATTGDASKFDAIKELGADVVLNYRDAELDAQIESAAPDGLDVWWETSREADLERIVPRMRLNGRVIVMAGRDAKPIFPLGPFYVKNLSLFGFAMFNFSPEDQRESAMELNRWLESGAFSPRIALELPIDDSQKAHELQEGATLQGSGEVAGKIVLKLD